MEGLTFNFYNKNVPKKKDEQIIISFIFIYFLLTYHAFRRLHTMIMQMTTTARSTAPPTAAPITVPLSFPPVLAPLSPGPTSPAVLDDAVMG